METKIENTFEYTNTCTCRNWDMDTDESTPSLDCYGDCWEYVLDDFNRLTTNLFDNNETLWWKVSNLKLWDGNHGGYGYAKDAESLLRLMTVKSEWNIEGEVFSDRIEYSLSHHDAPMGSNTVVTMITDEQREELGLY